MLIKILRILEHQASLRTQQFAWQFYRNTIFGVNNVSIFTVVGLSSSYRTFDYPPTLLESSCNWFFVFQALRCPRNPNFSFFLIPLQFHRPMERTVLRWCDTRGISPLRSAWFPAFVTEGCTENGSGLRYLCKQVGAMPWQFLFASGILVRLRPPLHVFKMGRVVILLFRI